ncbi:MAG: ArnT family glycosyltransferase [Gemmatimonadota bacterium]
MTGDGRALRLVVPLGLLGLTLAVHVIGLPIDLMDVDASQYAAISFEALEEGGRLGLTDRGAPYLGKPPLLFWLGAWSFRAFGVSDVAYKLPSFLGFVLGLLATYRLAALYAGPRAGWLAALILASSQGAFTMTQDVRTDTLLTGLVAFSLWQVAALLERPRLRHAALAGVGIGLGMLTKGLLALAIPLAAVVGDVALERRWRRLRRPEWIATLAIAGVLLVPALIGLHEQHGARGLRFFIWTQGPGRLVEDDVFGDVHGPLFLVPALLWTSMPWTLPLLLAVGSRLMASRKASLWLPDGKEGVALAAFLIGFVGLSLSRSKLPHYVYVLLPPAAVVTGAWLSRLGGERALPRFLKPAQACVLGLALALVSLLLFWSFPVGAPAIWAALVAAGAAAAFALLRFGPPVRGLVAASVLTSALVNLALDAHVYPRLLEYQATGRAGRWLRERGVAPGGLYAFRTGDRALDFYARRVAIEMSDVRSVRRRAASGDLWIFTDREGLQELRRDGLRPRVVRRYRHFHVSKVTPSFLNPATRPASLQERFILRVRAPPAQPG